MSDELYDPTPVDGPWLLSVGFEQKGDKDYLIYRSPQSTKAGPVASLQWEPLMGCDGWLITGNDNIPPFDTRGEVRMFCRAVGIELKEGT